MKKKRPGLFCFAYLCCIIFIFMVSGCGDLIQGKPAADEEIAEFHIHYNNAHFELIYDNAHPDFFSQLNLSKCRK